MRPPCAPQTVGVLSELEVAAFVRLVHSPDYPAILMKEDVFGAWLDGELVGTASWQANAANGVTARIGCDLRAPPPLWHRPPAA